MTTRVLPALALAAVIAACRPAMAVDPRSGAVVPVPYMLACGTTQQLETALAANGESIAARAAAIGGPQTQFWLNPASREWSVVFVDPASGQSCLVAAGSDFKAERPAPKPIEPHKDRAS